MEGSLRVTVTDYTLVSSLAVIFLNLPNSTGKKEISDTFLRVTSCVFGENSRAHLSQSLRSLNLLWDFEGFSRFTV